jgi:hypothetical protein
MLTNHRTVKGIALLRNGWAVAEVTTADDDGAPGESRIVKRRLVAGPYSGPGSKATAIREAGTNKVVPA